MPSTVVLFAGDTTGGENDLWETNGTAAGTFELAGDDYLGSPGLQPNNLTVYNGEVLFAAGDAGNYLWVTDGTAAGTHAVLHVFVSDLTVYNSEVLFSGTANGFNPGLWVTDGTAAGTHELTGIAEAGARGLLPQDLTHRIHDGRWLASPLGAG